ncbi:unnamed protein product [Cuscuta epithymum]|uniref:TPX2 C-terminal domain-containing protein n=1 Tax=Cuscuta epithymum TaxID=186058 RepID=A0AAV0ECQ1_9ASTE|nr:unnamed protein product [Cuscuta epithymum]
MAEISSPCMVPSFSQPFLKSCDGHEGDILRALTSSISFGRYMSESLAWDKWSTFTNNNYREEALRYSRPGSVAEKKAFFEARLKTGAAKKPAASPSTQQKTDHSSETGECGQETAIAVHSAVQQHICSEEQVEPDRGTDKNKLCKYEKMNIGVAATSGDPLVLHSSPHSSTTIKQSAKYGLPNPQPVKPPSVPPKKTDNCTSSSSKQESTKRSATKKQFTPRTLHVSTMKTERDDHEPIKKSSPIVLKIVDSKIVRAMTNTTSECRFKKYPLKVNTEEMHPDEKEQEIAVPKQTEEPILSSKQESTISSATKKQFTPRTLHVSTNKMEHDDHEPIKRSSPIVLKSVNSKIVRAMTNTTLECRLRKSLLSVNTLEMHPDEKKDQESAALNQTEEPILCQNTVKLSDYTSCLDENIEPKERTVTMGESDETTCSSAAMTPAIKVGLLKPRPMKPPPSIQSKKSEHSTAGALDVTVRFEHHESIKKSSPALQKMVNSKFVRAVTDNTTRESRSKKSPIRATGYSLPKHVLSEPASTRGSNFLSPRANISTTKPSSITCSSFVFRSEERAIKRKEFKQKLEQKLKEEKQMQSKTTDKRTNVTNHLKRGDSPHNTMKKMPEVQKPVWKVQENSSRPPWRVSIKPDSSKEAVVVKPQTPLSRSAKSIVASYRNANASSHTSRFEYKKGNVDCKEQ